MILVGTDIEADMYDLLPKSRNLPESFLHYYHVLQLRFDRCIFYWVPQWSSHSFRFLAFHVMMVRPRMELARL